MAWYNSVTGGLAAYDAYSAASYAASKVNLLNSGTYDLTDGVAHPSWAAGTGWTFAAASSQYLTSGIIPAAFDNTWSMFVLFSGSDTVSQRPLLSAGDNDNTKYFDLWSSNFGANRFYGMGNKSANGAGKVAAGWMGISGRNCWWNGAIEATLDAATVTTATGTAIQVGREETKGWYYDGVILRIWIANRAVTDAEARKLYAEMTNPSTETADVLTFPRFWVDIENAAGAKQGSGPITTARYWEHTERLSGAGRFRFSMPGKDSKYAIATKKRIARAHAVVNSEVVEIGAGVIDSIERSPNSARNVECVIGGNDLLRELTNTTVGALLIDDGGGGADTNGPDDIIGMAYTGWSLDADEGFETTYKAVYHQFEGESVLEAFTRLSDLTGEHFRRGTGRKIIWMRRYGSAKLVGVETGAFTPGETVTGGTSGATGTMREDGTTWLYIEDVTGSFVDGEDVEGGTSGETFTVTTAYNPSSGVRAILGGNPYALESNTEACIIQSLTELEDSYDGLIGRVYAIGNGIGDAKLELDGVVTVPPVGYTLDSTAGVGYYLQHDATWAAYGIERVVAFKDIEDVEALYEQAYEYLSRATGSQVAYRIKVAKLDTTLPVGKSIRVVYQLYVDEELILDIDDDLVILEARHRFDNGKMRTVELVVSTVDAWPEDSTSTLVSAIQTVDAFSFHPQSVDAGDINGDVTLTSAKIGGASNYVNIDSSGEITFVGTATVWDDERVPITSTKLGGSKDPSFAKFKDNGAGSQGVFVYWFDPDAEEELFLSLQLPHSYKEGSQLYPHVHFAPKTDGASGATVEWGLEYTVASVGGTYGNTSLVYGKVHTPADAVLAAFKHYLTPVPTGGISGSGLTISAMLIGRIFRNATDGTDDTYADDAALLEFDVHYEIDSVGSKTETAK